MAYRIKAKVLYKSGVIIHYDSGPLIGVNKPRINSLLEEMRRIVKTAYKENTTGQLTVGTAVIDLQSTASIDLKKKGWFF